MGGERRIAVLVHARHPGPGLLGPHTAGGLLTRDGDRDDVAAGILERCLRRGVEHQLARVVERADLEGIAEREISHLQGVPIAAVARVAAAVTAVDRPGRQRASGSLPGAPAAT
jgi:hypothetical protein